MALFKDAECAAVVPYCSLNFWDVTPGVMDRCYWEGFSTVWPDTYHMGYEWDHGQYHHVMLSWKLRPRPAMVDLERGGLRRNSFSRKLKQE